MQRYVAQSKLTVLMTFSPFKVRKWVIISFCVDFILCQVLLSFFTHGSSPANKLLIKTRMMKIFNATQGFKWILNNREKARRSFSQKNEG